MTHEGQELALGILRAIRRILRQVSNYSRRLASDGGLTVPQYLCLRAIAEAPPDGPVTVASVSRHVQLSPATVSRILDRLERIGCVRRERRSDDRRKVDLWLTDEGRDRLGRIRAPLHEQFLERLAALDVAEQRSLLDALERIVDMMEAKDLDASPVLTPELDVRKDLEENGEG